MQSACINQLLQIRHDDTNHSSFINHRVAGRRFKRLVGVGGGIIIVPALMLITGYTQHQAQGTSLGLLLLPVGILATLNYYRKGYVDIKAVLIMAVTFTIGGWLGSKLSVSISDVMLKRFLLFHLSS